MLVEYESELLSIGWFDGESSTNGEVVKDGSNREERMENEVGMGCADSQEARDRNCG
jgi:hypothetical protein